MIKYELIDKVRRTVTISLEASSPHERANIVIAGDESLKAIVSDKLSRSYGAFGHTVGEVTSPIDLDSALRSSVFKDYRIGLTQGKELVSSYGSGISKGAVT